jgi:hypothetical protein
MKKQAKSGILHDFSGKDLPRDVITWHEENGYRVWVHSRLTLTGYNPMSIEVQWEGNGESELTEIEKSARLQLAKVKSGAPNEVHFNSTSLRGLSLGKVLDQHSVLVASRKLSETSDENMRIHLVKDFEEKTYTSEFQLASLNSGKGPKVELTANNQDSILIASVYSDISQSGSKRPAKATASYLHIETSLVYVAVRTARKNNWLTSAGSGTAGGILTDSGNLHFKNIKGDVLLEKYISQFGGGRK